MRGTFRSSDYLFRPTAISEAFSSLGVKNVPLVREPRFEVNGKMFHAEAKAA